MIERYLSFLLLFKCMLQLIKTGLEKRIYDEVMETAWSALWNVTGILKAETVKGVDQITVFVITLRSIFISHSFREEESNL